MGVMVQEPLAKEAQALQPLAEESVVPRRRMGLRHCCCSCSLQAGCICIGTLTTVHGVYLLFISILSLSFGVHMDYDDEVARKVFMVLYGCLNLMTGLSLIYGTDKRRPSLIKFWLYTRYVEFVLIIIGIVICICALMFMHSVPAGVALPLLAYFSIIIGVFLYIMFVVRSFCYEITDSVKAQTQRQILKAEI